MIKDYSVQNQKTGAASHSAFYSDPTPLCMVRADHALDRHENILTTPNALPELDVSWG
jgi:hypothetical protein